MRDTSDHMVELLAVSRRDGIYSSTIRLDVGGKTYKFKFGIEPDDYYCHLRILEFRPFQDTGFAAYRYFFTGGYAARRKNDPMTLGVVRVEQDRMHKQFEFDISKAYVANILWFQGLQDVGEARDLIVE